MAHPTESLSIGSDDQIAQLARLLPVTLANDQQYQSKLLPLRNSQQYIFVMAWLYQCRGFVKLHNEYFDADLFEIELLNLVSPPPVDDSVLFINKLKVGLIVALRGGSAKNTSSEEFEAVFREWFGIETPLGGPVDENDTSELLQFDYLFIESKIDVLYSAISYVSSLNAFRTFVDRNQLTADDLKPENLHTEVLEDNEQVDYLLMFDNTRLYKRTVTYPELVVKKKRLEAPAVPEEHFDESQFDVASVEYELVFKDIYKLDEYLKLIPKKSKKLKDLRAALASEAVVDSLFYAETRKRKILSHRRKELQLANLLATRKKSTRIEARDRERQRELQIERQKQEEQMRLATETRLERRLMAREQASNSYVAPVAAPLTREERLRIRQAKVLMSPAAEGDIERVNGDKNEEEDTDKDERKEVTENVEKTDQQLKERQSERTHTAEAGDRENTSDMLVDTKVQTAYLMESDQSTVNTSVNDTKTLNDHASPLPDQPPAKRPRVESETSAQFAADVPPSNSVSHQKHQYQHHNNQHTQASHPGTSGNNGFQPIQYTQPHAFAYPQVPGYPQVPLGYAQPQGYAPVQYPQPVQYSQPSMALTGYIKHQSQQPNFQQTNGFPAPQMRPLNTADLAAGHGLAEPSVDEPAEKRAAQFPACETISTSAQSPSGASSARPDDPTN